MENVRKLLRGISRVSYGGKHAEECECQASMQHDPAQRGNEQWQLEKRQSMRINEQHYNIRKYVKIMFSLGGPKPCRNG